MKHHKVSAILDTFDVILVTNLSVAQKFETYSIDFGEAASYGITSINQRVNQFFSPIKQFTIYSPLPYPCDMYCNNTDTFI